MIFRISCDVQRSRCRVKDRRLISRVANGRAILFEAKRFLNKNINIL